MLEHKFVFFILERVGKNGVVLCCTLRSEAPTEGVAWLVCASCCMVSIVILFLE